ncbi:CHAT domain-containing protein [Kitasatospora sp. NPDC051984]|uniref:CHAT domain-containing tetratricopeptide repeat protein n=1 Tax=Kitasatospora sp. NPDC051984 TaxID=3364059 RepID=UPI0037CC7131
MAKRYEEAVRLMRQCHEDASPEPAAAAIAAVRDVVDSGLFDRVVDGDHLRALFMCELCSLLRNRFEHTGNADYLTEAVEWGRAGTAGARPGRMPWAAGPAVLSQALRARAELTGDRADLAAAVDAAQLAVDRADRNSAERIDYLGILGNALQASFEQSGAAADLDGAITVLQEQNAAPATGIERSRRANNLGNALRCRHTLTGDEQALAAAVEAFDTAAKSAPLDHSQRPLFLSNLALILSERFDRHARTVDLDRSIRLQQEAVDTTPATAAARGRYQSNLAGAYLRRYARLGTPADLDRAIDLGQSTAAAAGETHPDHLGALVNLGVALHWRFERTGSQADLDRAVECYQAAAAATPEGHLKRPERLVNLGSVLHERHRRIGSTADLDAAIKILRAAVRIIPDQHTNRGTGLNNLGTALQTRYFLDFDQEDLEEAFNAFEEAVNAVSAGHPSLPMYLCNLGGAAHARYGRTGDPTALDIAVNAIEASIKATPPDDHSLAIRFYSLGSVLHSQYVVDQEPTTLDRAIEAHRGALAATADGDGAHARRAAALGRAFQDRHARTGRTEDRDQAIAAFETAARNGAAGAIVRTETARRAAGLLASDQPARAADLAELAVRLLPEVTPRRLARGDQQRALGEFDGLAGEAAELALACPGMPVDARAARALRLLEGGRAVLLGQAIDVRTDLSDLTDRHPALAERFTTLRDLLDGVDTPRTSGPTEQEARGGSVGQPRLPDVDPRQRQAVELAAVLAEIRQCDGFAAFGLPPTDEELVAAAAHGPIVVLNVGRYRSHALLVTPSGISALELPTLTRSGVQAHSRDFAAALEASTTPGPAAKEGRKRAQTDIHATLAWLWDSVTGPVLATLGFHSTPAAGSPWPTVWWIPGGLFGGLPLHGAGHHADPADALDRRAVLDRVVSSYSPTIRALRHARRPRRSADPSGAVRALVVAMPKTPGQSDLNGVEQEADRLVDRLPGAVLLAELPQGTGHAPTRAAVLAALPDYPIVHFACHGYSDPGDPSNSQLLLQDHADAPLTVGSLAPVNLERAELAYLSACHTATVNSEGLLDEAIHLTSTFQLAGYPHVIGTLWAVNDDLSADVADHFYAALLDDTGPPAPGRAAYALHQAVRAARAAQPAPSRWAAYLHAGA